ncbi:phage tail tip lysozyme [Methylobacterium komagatae]|uniref:Phage tail tip lysozyme n=1 Tax=Methylobacterium komagatae TaxID=374425 RepID=A0ABW2BGS8_9HYPH
MVRPPSPGVSAVDPFAARCARLGPALMRDLALTDVQAAGLLGNLGHETGGFRHLQEIAPLKRGSRGGWGLAQWTGPRRVAMEQWSRVHGLDPASDAANEGYLVAELRGPEADALAALRRSVTLAQATETVCRLFERPGIPALPRRLVWARRALTAIRGRPAQSLSTPPRRRR